MSISMNSFDNSENVSSIMGFAGPLRKERQNFFTQRSGHLYINRNQEVVSEPPRSVLQQKNTETKLERYTYSVSGTNNNQWPSDDYAGKNEHLPKSGLLGMCNDPYCTTCPMYYNLKWRQKHSRTAKIYDAKFQNMFSGDAKGWAKNTCSILLPYLRGIMNPHSKFVQWWNKFFVISCMFAVFIDPLFFFPLSVMQGNKCIVLNWPMTTTIEQWMSHHRLPEELRRSVLFYQKEYQHQIDWTESETQSVFNWAVTRGVNEEILMEDLPENLQREIRRHLFKFVKKVRIFQLLDEPIIDSICERLRIKTYIQRSKILYRGSLVDKMTFIIRGKMESIGEDHNVVPLSEGDVCGEELLTWCLEHFSVNKGTNHLTGEHLQLDEYKLHGGIGRNDVLATTRPPSAHQIMKPLYQSLKLTFICSSIHTHVYVRKHTQIRISSIHTTVFYTFYRPIL